jgi:TonB-linked SusC/RagA family outer membrane protein
MKKTTTIAQGLKTHKKPLLIMKLTLLFTFFCTFHAMAGMKAQTVTVKATETEIYKILTTIEKQGNYRFLFNSQLKDLSKKVTMNFDDENVEVALQKLFAATSLTYRHLEDNLIAIRSSNPSESDIKITGRITNEAGEGLVAAIIVKGTKTGTSTDANGNFVITVSENAVLLFSAVGYEPQEVAVNGRQQITVLMVQSAKKIDEVVVIGYGTASKRDLTGSITKVSGKEVADKPNTNPIASLQGKVAGLTVVNSGRPGQEPDIRIRGTVSLNQTKPLYIVDGIFNDNISFVNPADIESLEVLKDPSSLAIFGVRGANGVVIITTKKGKVGKLSVNLNSSLGFKNIVGKPELTDAAGFITLFDEQRANQGAAPFAYYNLFQGNSNWVDLIENKNAIINTNNISISSGTEKNKFYMGVGYIKEEGVIKYETLDKISLSISDELKVSKNFKIGFNVNGYRAMLPNSRSFGSALNATPIVEAFNSTKGVYNKLPDEIGGPQIGNPLMGVEETKNTSINREYRILGSAFAEFNFLKNFTFRTNILTDLGFNDGRNYTPLINVYAAEVNQVVPQGGFTRTSVGQYKNSYTKFQQDYLLTYKKKFGDHSLTALGGFTTYFDDYSAISGSVAQYATGDAIPNDKRWWYLDVFPYGDPTTRIANSGEWERTTVSTLFRALYNYKGKYMLNTSFRRDGSSEISPNNRYQNFWAVGAAWDMTKESFMANQKYFDNFKVKASIGRLGNQYNAVHYPYYPNYVTGSTAVFGENIVPAFVLAYRNNPNLKWETVDSYEGGIEFDALKRKLHFEGNYYNKKTNDLLTFVNDGADRFYTNSGSIESKGFEFLASWNATTKFGLGYSVTGNITTIKSNVLSIYKPGYKIIAGQSRTIEGFPIGHFYGYVVEGVYQSYADKLQFPDASALGDYGPGDLRYKDVNNDGVITSDDRTIIGNPTPDFTYGISTSVNYKGLDISADFQGVYGNEIWRGWGNGTSFAPFNYRAERLGRWNGYGTSTWEPRVSDLAAINRENSTYMIEDGSYFRLRNIQLGYTISPKLLAKAHIQALRVYVNGQNLKTWKRNSGFTPEAGGSATSFGVDGGGYPVPAIISVGFNVTF